MAANILKLTFDKAVSITTAGWSVTGTEGAISILSVSGSGTTTPQFTLSRDVEIGEVLTVSYNSATGNTITVENSLEITTISDSPIENNVTKPIGVIYEKTSFSNFDDFTENTATISIVDDAIQFTGGDGTFLRSLSLANKYTSLEKWKITATVKAVNNPSGTSYGAGFGIKSKNTESPVHFVGHFLMHTPDVGKCYMWGGDGSGMYDEIQPGSTSLMTYVANDLIEVIVERNGLDFSVSSKNLTTPTGTSVTTKSFNTLPAEPYLHNTGLFTIWSVGGTFQVKGIKIESSEICGADIVMVGDSKCVGYCVTDENNRIAKLLSDEYGIVVVSAGGGDGLQDMLNRIDEIKTLKPKIYFLGGASNDIRRSVPSGTINTNYTDLVSELATTGARIVHSTGFKETSLNQSALRTNIFSEYDISDIVDTLPENLDLNADEVHPNDIGNMQAADFIIGTGELGL